MVVSLGDPRPGWKAARFGGGRSGYSAGVVHETTSLRSPGSSNTVLLLRHAPAGTKRLDRAADRTRGLDRRGARIASTLPERLERRFEVGEIVSSPYRRCLETVEPLASRLGLAPLPDERLEPGRSPGEAEAAVHDAPAGAVICTHGEVLKALLGDSVACAKGAGWIVERARGRITPVAYITAADAVDDEEVSQMGKQQDRAMKERRRRRSRAAAYTSLALGAGSVVAGGTALALSGSRRRLVRTVKTALPDPAAALNLATEHVPGLAAHLGANGTAGAPSKKGKKGKKQKAG